MLSIRELSVTFGLGEDVVVKMVDVIWPSGLKEMLRDLKVNQTIILREGEAPK